MPKVSDEHRAARRDQILDASMRLLTTKGYRGTSMTDIIRESGLSAGAIYGYFASKTEIFQAVASRVLDIRLTELPSRRGEEPRSPGELMRTIVSSISSLPLADVIPQVWAEATIDPDVRTMMSGSLGGLRSAIRDEIAAWGAANPDRIEGEPVDWATRVTPVFLGALPGFIVQRLVFPEFDEEAYLDALPLAYPH